jgi:transposase
LTLKKSRYLLAGIVPEDEYTAHDPVHITPTDEHYIIPVFQDECTYNANDGCHQIWCSKTNQPLRKKGRGPGIMVSDFMTPGGPLRAPRKIREQDLPDWGVQEGFRKDRYAARVQLECGGDTWFNAEQLRAQTVLAAIPLFEAAHPGCKALFVFDNATIHSSYRDDALLAQNVALNPGKGTAVRDTFDYRNNRPQKMKDADGKSRGLRAILQERGLWRNGMRVQCYKSDGNIDPACLGHCTKCARGIISQERDFREQKTELEEEIVSRGHLCIFLPKFHPETNPIEYYWGATKLFTRKNCGYSLSALRKTVPQALSSVPRTQILKYFKKVERICQIYASGERYGTEAFQQKAYKSHRRVFAGAC